MDTTDNCLQQLGAVLAAKEPPETGVLAKAMRSWESRYKDTLCFKVYFEKPTNANPYYVLNNGLQAATALVEELLALQLPTDGSAAAAAARTALGEALGVQPGQLAQTFAKAGLSGFFATLAGCCVEVASFYGGTRSTIPHDCQLELRLALYKDMDKEQARQTIHALVAKHNGKLEA